MHFGHLWFIFHSADVEAKKESKGTQRERNVYAKMLQSD